MVDMPIGLIRIFVPLAGFVGVLVGVLLILRISRDGDRPGASWRYRDLSSDLAFRPALEGRRSSPRHPGRDVAAARRMARSMLAVAIAMPFAVLLVWVTQPGFSRGMFEPQWYEVALPWAGAAGYLLGLGWMIRIYHADPEPGDPTWRYRDH